MHRSRTYNIGTDYKDLRSLVRAMKDQEPHCMWKRRTRPISFCLNVFFGNFYSMTRTPALG
jgi:hypothetical protein